MQWLQQAHVQVGIHSAVGVHVGVASNVRALNPRHGAECGQEKLEARRNQPRIVRIRVEAICPLRLQ